MDSSGNKGGVTWNWGYQYAKQYSGGDIIMNNDAGVAASSERMTDGPELGADFDYVRDLTHKSWGQLGIKLAFGYTPIHVRDQDPLAANAEVITDKYPLYGVIPPSAPYTGSFGGPGPVLGTTPASHTVTETPDGAIIYGNHNIDADLFDIRIGPTANIRLYKRLSLQIGGGFALGIVHGYFTYADASAPGGPTTASGSDSRTSLEPGGYAEAGFAYQLCRSWSLYTGAQFEYLENFQQSANGRTAELDLGQTIFYQFGIEWHF